MEVLAPVDCKPTNPVLGHEGWELRWPCGVKVIGIDSRDLFKARRDHQCPM